jgi:hypothetical protein
MPCLRCGLRSPHDKADLDRPWPIAILAALLLVYFARRAGRHKEQHGWNGFIRKRATLQRAR